VPTTCNFRLPVAAALGKIKAASNFYVMKVSAQIIAGILVVAIAGDATYLFILEAKHGNEAKRVQHVDWYGTTAQI